MLYDIDSMTRNKDLYAALLKAKTDLPVVGKNRSANIQTNGGRSYQYTYADLADIDREVTPVLTEHGLIVDFQMHKGDDGEPVLTGALIHPESGGFKTSEWVVTGRTPQDQGSSITYGRRYLMGILTGLITDDDTDGQQTQPGATTRAPKRTPKPANPATPEQVEQIMQLGRDGMNVRDLMQQVIDRQATPTDLTHGEAVKILGAAETYTA